MELDRFYEDILRPLRDEISLAANALLTVGQRARDCHKRSVVAGLLQLALSPKML
ncbi:hypothetical protein M419DRAFT_119653 [Trichoderma reesei RUT C-30]|uniref:Uncharacterized protein n=1 Tax=Hypocrea jecorina (strain ATCC 56765 / BCRC 32924 / NRRL 11460 / Rut C-30) TaxID=1344414 RepID=A0A024S992_HYPJR|nr:hypothetical protein M419DRAFT_119653 [Trichoderma reesei RUT C-30]